MMNVIFAVLVLGVIAVVFGLVLSVAAKAFEVEVDERLPKIKSASPARTAAAAVIPAARAAPRPFWPARLPSTPARPPARRALRRSPPSWAWKPPAAKRWSLM